jgi:RNA 2',3'-cyclic 3'-phosphodiesterase
MRLFIGIPLAATTTRDLGAIADHLRSRTASESLLRWSATESWHITLQFLGSTTPQQYECVTARLRELHQPPVAVELGAVDTFDRAGVLFVDVRVSPQLAALQQGVIAATIPCGFVPESRFYHPHITLARRKGRAGDRELRNLKSQIDTLPQFASFTADSFVLYESAPTPAGSRYEVRERFLLTAAPADEHASTRHIGADPRG